MDSLQIVRWCIFGFGILNIILGVGNILFLLFAVLCCLTLNMLPLKRKEAKEIQQKIMPTQEEVHKLDKPIQVDEKEKQRMELLNRREEILERVREIKTAEAKPKYRILDGVD